MSSIRVAVAAFVGGALGAGKLSLAGRDGDRDVYDACREAWQELKLKLFSGGRLKIDRHHRFSGVR